MASIRVCPRLQHGEEELFAEEGVLAKQDADRHEVEDNEFLEEEVQPISTCRKGDI